MKTLRGLRAPQSFARDGGRDPAVKAALEGVADRERRDGRGRGVKGVEDPADEVRRREGACGIMDQHPLGRTLRQALQAEERRVLAGRSAGDRRQEIEIGGGPIIVAAIVGMDHRTDRADTRVPAKGAEAMS